MRHSPRAARAWLFGFVIAVVSGPAFSQNLGLTVDLMAPTTACTGSKCPSDISLPNLGSSIPADQGNYDGTTGVTATLTTGAASPIVCSEQHGTQSFGAVGSFVFSPSYYNPSPTGGLFEFDAGGPSVVDAGTVNYGFNSSQTLLEVNKANTLSTQVACYSINALGVDHPMYADSSVSGDRVFYGEFEGGHRGDEPWVSVNTVNAVSTASAVLGYVVQVHNASYAANWHLSFGYDHSFSQTVNSGFPGHWYILGPSIPQPGQIPTSLTGTMNADFNTIYVVNPTDIHSDSNSLFIYVLNHSTAAMASAWATLPTSFYSASAAVFAPPGTYVQRIDDKVAVVGNVNLPTQNIGNIVCANDPLATACTITDPDGAGIPSSITFKNQFAAGSVTADPVAYVVDTGAGTTLPSTTISLAAPSNVSCADPNGILLGSVSFAASSGAVGAQALTFAFKPAATLYVPGTAVCTATFTANGFSSTQTFNITMQQVNVTHFDVTTDNSSVTAGGSVNATVTAKDGAGNSVPTYNGTVTFSSSDPMAVLPTNSHLTLGTGTFSVTLKKSGAQTITAKDTSSSTITGTSPAVSVTAASAASFVVQMLSQAEVNNSNTQVNVTPYDQYNNRVTGGYTGTVHFTSTDSSAVLPVDAAFTNGIYNVTFKTVSPPDYTVTATDTATSTITGTSNPVTVVAD